jgi:hypothetical protein
MMGREAVVARLDRAARFVEADRAAAGDSR